jgi:hypothetical protein
MVWQQETGAYTQKARPRGGPNCPVEDDIDVISVLASASLVTPEANIVYPPIGPYLAGRLEVFDAASPESGSKARGHGYDDSNCSLCLRVTQGGKATAYLVKTGLQPGGDPKDAKTFEVFAINLPARDGEIMQADLLHTPGVMSKGLAPDAKVLFSWKASSPATHKTEYVTALYPSSAEPLTAATSTNATSAATRTEGPAHARPSALAVANTRVAQMSAATTPRVTVPEELLTEWMGKLRQRIAASAKAGQPLKGWVNVQGKAAAYPLLGADEKQLQVKIDGNVMPLPWSWLKESDVLALVKSLAREDEVESQLMLAVFLLANGQMDAGETTLARAALLNAAAAEEVRERLKWP